MATHGAGQRCRTGAASAGRCRGPIARTVGVSRPTVYQCIEKATNMGPDAALRALPRPGASLRFQTAARLGLYAWPVNNPRTSDWRRSCGHFRPWLAMCASTRWQPVFHADPVSVKWRYGASWMTTINGSRIASGIIWNARIPTLRKTGPKCWWSISRFRCQRPSQLAPSLPFTA